MTSMINNGQQRIWLNELKDDLAIFSPDTIALIKGYLPRTGLKTGLITTLEKMREEVMSGENRALNRTYNSIRSELIKYIDGRIQEMITPKECPWTDPWLLLSQTLGSQELLETSLHIHDILFTAHIVAEHKLLQGQELAIHEIHELKELITEKYLKLLTLSAVHEDARKTLTELQNALPKELEALETSLKGGDFEKAQRILKQADDEMRVSSEALRILTGPELLQERP